MTDSLATLFATEPPDGTVLVIAYRDELRLVYRNDNAAREVAARWAGINSGDRWFDARMRDEPMTLAWFLTDATEVRVAVPLEQAGLAPMSGEGGC